MHQQNIFSSGLKKVAATILTQGVILLLSLVVGFILPKRLGTEAYGYWQVYLFYLGYLNLLGLGYNDGIALYYGGYDYDNLPFQKFRNAFFVVMWYLFLVTLGLLFFSSFAVDVTMRRIYYMLALNVPLTCIQCIVLTTFLSVNKTGIYNMINLLIRATTAGAYLLLLFGGYAHAEYMMYADFTMRVCITILCMILGREFLFGGKINLKAGLKELTEKAKAGFFITIATIAAVLIPVAGRVVIEWNESKAVYGIYSFALSLLSLIIMFTNTVGSVVFPILKRLPKEKLPIYYSKFSRVCEGLIYIALLAYAPLVLVVQYFMPAYIPALQYLHILLAMCLPLGKFQLLLIAYYKALRLEKEFLLINIVGALGMITVNMISYTLFHSVLAVAISTTSFLTIWCFSSERYLSVKMELPVSLLKNMGDLSMLIAFIFAAGTQSLLVFTSFYMSILIMYFYLNKKRYVNDFRLLSSLEQ